MTRLYAPLFLVLAAGSARGEPWAQQVDARPLTLDEGTSEAHLDLAVNAVRFVDITSGAVSVNTAEQFAVGGAVALTPAIDLGIDYQLTLSEFEAKGPISFRVRYRITHSDTFDVAAGAAMTYDLLASNGDFFLGADVRYRPIPELAIGTSTTQVAGPAVPNFGPMAGQLALAFTRGTMATGESPPLPITLDLPVYIAYTPQPKVRLFLSTNLGQINLSNSSNAFIFSKLIPITAGVFYTPRKTIDFGFAFWDDIEHIKDAYDVFAVARFYKL